MITSGPLPSTATVKRGGAAAAASAWAGAVTARLRSSAAVIAAAKRILRIIGIAFLRSVVREDGFDRKLEERGDAEGERQARIIFAGLDGVDALPGDLQPLGEIALAPVALGAQHLESVLHLMKSRTVPARPSPTHQTMKA